VDVAIGTPNGNGNGNWNGLDLGAAVVQPECIGNATEMLWWCCNHLIAANAAALLQMLGAKQGQDMYLAGQLLPSSQKNKRHLAPSTAV
jgi:hypothetical protein